MFDYANLSNELVKDIFTDEQYAKLYSRINSTDEQYISRIEDTGYEAYRDPLDEELSDVVKNILEKISGVKLRKYMAHYARYFNDENSVPLLRPHYDVGLDISTVSLTIILDSTLDWDIQTETGMFSPKKNQGVTFSGTHQIHWRPIKKFGKDDYYDIIVCQYILEDSVDAITEEHRSKMSAKNGDICVQWEFENPDGEYDDKDWLIANYQNGPMALTDLCVKFNRGKNIMEYFLNKHNITLKGNDK